MGYRPSVFISHWIRYAERDTSGHMRYLLSGNYKNILLSSFLVPYGWVVFPGCSDCNSHYRHANTKHRHFTMAFTLELQHRSAGNTTFLLFGLHHTPLWNTSSSVLNPRFFPWTARASPLTTPLSTYRYIAEQRASIEHRSGIVRDSLLHTCTYPRGIPTKRLSRCWFLYLFHHYYQKSH